MKKPENRPVTIEWESSGSDGVGWAEIRLW